MTPDEWKDILFRQHIQRLTSLLQTIPIDSAEKNEGSKPSKPKPVFTLITDGDDEFSEQDESQADPDQSDEVVRRLPISVDDALEDINERRLLYITFRHILMSSLDTLEALAYGTRELIPAGARWFLEAWMKYPLLDERDFCFRMKIFGSFKRLYSTLSSMHPPPANRDVVKKHLKSALSLESAMDLTTTLLVDIEGWNKDLELTNIAWTVRINDLMPPGDPDQEENQRDEIFKSLDKIAQDLRNLPFHPPRAVDEERLTQYISELRSRSDGYCLLLSLMESLAVRMSTARKKSVLRRKSQGVIRGASGNSFVYQDDWNHRVSGGGRPVQMDPDTVIAFTKLEWVATFVAQQTHSSIPTPALCLSALMIVRRVSKLVDPDNINMSWKENAGELESRLEYSYNRQQSGVKSGGSPPYAMTRSRTPPFFIKLLQQKRKKEVETGAALASDFPSEDSLVKELSSVKNELEDVIASLEDMWFQVDSTSDRIVVKPSSHSQEKYSDETLISVQSGTLVLTRKELVWSSSRSFNGVGTGVDLEAGIRVPYSSIIRFSYGRLDTQPSALPPVLPLLAPQPTGASTHNAEQHQAGADVSAGDGGSATGSGSVPTTGPATGKGGDMHRRNRSTVSFEGLPTINDSVNGGNGEGRKGENKEGGGGILAGQGNLTGDSSSDQGTTGFPNLKSSFTKRMSLRFKSQPTRKKSYHLDIHTRDEVFKFFPFHGDEIHQMIRALSSISGLVPFKEEEFVQNVLCKKLELTRRQALKYLLEEENPWIEHSADLTAVIQALTSENQPQRIVDMERLFHSCRIEVEVTKEAIFLLRKTWHTSQSENVKLKVLSVVDRLLDRVIMRQGDPNFGVTFKWLKLLEETVSPYKSSEALRLIIHLVRRAKMIQIEPLSPVVRNQCNSLFDSFNDHSFLQNFYEDMEEYGIPI
ncbi:hypothetical protein HDU67_003541 [Dinochytrium kinnereticum]|nr:hypothetical protein HDU67_003541 [Dinochytrium kinnereticum]